MDKNNNKQFTIKTCYEIIDDALKLLILQIKYDIRVDGYRDEVFKHSSDFSRKARLEAIEARLEYWPPDCCIDMREISLKASTRRAFDKKKKNPDGFFNKKIRKKEL